MITENLSTSWHNYGKIYNLGHRAVQDLFLEPVIVEEKVDGSQFSFGIFNGELRCKSRRMSIDIENVDSNFALAVETILNLKDKLQNGWTYRGEVLSKPKHNTLAYSRVPAGYIIIFDIATDEECYLSYKDKKKEAERLGLEVVPILYEGKVSTSEEIHKFLETESILGGTTVEGVVIKNYSRFGADGKTLMGKYVSEKFKERNNKEWKKIRETRDIITQLLEVYKTEARWEKAIQHLRDEGKLQNDPRDIGPLLKEINSDIHTECEDEIKEILFRWAWKQLAKRLTTGFPEWYKERLLESQFEEKE